MSADHLSAEEALIAPIVAAIARQGSGPEAAPAPGARAIRGRQGAVYLLQERVGSGGFGAVYKATGPEDKTVAVKWLPANRGADDEARGRFQREARHLEGLNHPNIVQFLDFAEDDHGLYLVMEYVGDVTLEQEWPARRSCMSGQQWRHVARDLQGVARALHSIHRQGVVHRDLKPSNLMRGADGALKLIDFGLGRALEPGDTFTRGGLAVGTVAYMSPEQAWGDLGQVGPATDVWGLGAVLCYLLTGQPPFPGPHVVAMANLRDSQITPRPLQELAPDLPRDLTLVCRNCLHKAAEDRYASAEALAEDLGRCAEGKRPLKQPPGPLARMSRWARRNRAAASVIAILLALSGALAGVAYLAYHNGAAARAFAGQAETNARQADAERTKAERLAFDRLVDAARYARRSGQLIPALRLYDRAVPAASAEERPALEVERLRCLFAYGHWPRLKEELGRLQEGQGLPASLRAEVMLHRGDLLLWEPGHQQQERGRALVRQALGVKDGLTAADAAYARGLLAEAVADAVRDFEEALRHDRSHLRAAASLLVALVLSGQFEPALRKAEFLAAVFPDEPVTPLALALVATLQEDVPARRRHLVDLRRRVNDPQRMAVLEGLFASLDLTVQLSRMLHSPVEGPDGPRLAAPLRFEQLFGPEQLLRLLRRGALAGELGEVSAVVGVGLPALSRPLDLLEALVQAQKKLEKGDDGAAFAILEQAGRKHPESLLLLMQAAARLRQALALQRRGDLAGCFRLTRQAHQLADRAARAPTLLPFGPYRHNAHWLCVLLEVSWSSQHRFDGARLGALAVGGNLLPSSAGPLATAAALAAGQAVLQTYPRRPDRRHLLAVAAGARGHDEARAQLLPPLLPHFEAEDARLLLSVWASEVPQALAPCRLRARLELDLGNHAEALRWAERALALRPADREMRQLRERAREGMRSPAPKVGYHPAPRQRILAELTRRDRATRE
jgi:tetratricopeptide (TPR) repeat protein